MHCDEHHCSSTDFTRYTRRWRDLTFTRKREIRIDPDKETTCSSGEVLLFKSKYTIRGSRRISTLWSSPLYNIDHFFSFTFTVTRMSESTLSDLRSDSTWDIYDILCFPSSYLVVDESEDTRSRSCSTFDFWRCRNFTETSSSVRRSCFFVTHESIPYASCIRIKGCLGTRKTTLSFERILTFSWTLFWDTIIHRIE